LRVDIEVVDWFKIQRSGLSDADQPDLETSDGGGEEAGGRDVESVEIPTQAKVGLEWGTRLS